MVNNLSSVRAFAEHLEKEGDWYRSITEYQRYLYLLGKSDDNTAYKIAELYGKMSQFENAFDVLQKIENKNNKQYTYDLGRIYFLAGDYTSARIYWRGDDTLVSWINLKEGKFETAAEFFKIADYPKQKSQLLGGFLSAFVPGLGRLYTGRKTDAFTSFILTVSSGLSSYYYFKEGKDVPAYILGGLCLGFYLGDIYGAVVSVRHYNQKVNDNYVKHIEIMLNLEEKLW